ncbi:MAG TPA: hypothetical protein VNH22_06840 [Blastocatellia bacterium]|jgi:hypothetical protein|nr:hypothetical protein [Blastocatellia bacterium]
MAEDKVLKSGQITLPRILFLLVAGGLITATVALGGVWLAVGYWMITITLCVLLYLISIDYGVTLDTSDYKAQSLAQAAALNSEAGEAPRSALAEAKARRKPTRVTKRRR